MHYVEQAPLHLLQMASHLLSGQFGILADDGVVYLQVALVSRTHPSALFGDAGEHPPEGRLAEEEPDARLVELGQHRVLGRSHHRAMEAAVGGVILRLVLGVHPLQASGKLGEIVGGAVGCG